MVLLGAALFVGLLGWEFAARPDRGLMGILSKGIALAAFLYALKEVVVYRRELRDYFESARR
jgi:hypothetical protein